MLTLLVMAQTHIDPTRAAGDLHDREAARWLRTFLRHLEEALKEEPEMRRKMAEILARYRGGRERD